MIRREDAAAQLPSLQHVPIQPMLLGCLSCADRYLCGGLRVSASLFNCLGHCTACNPRKCDQVCPRNIRYAERIREVNGFELMTLDRRAPLPLPTLPDHAHIMFRNPKLEGWITQPYAAIPLSETYLDHGKIALALSRDEVLEKFRLAPSTSIIITGTEDDTHVEKWWKYGGNKSLLSAIAKIGAILVTTPNFSSIADAPRHDNMHSMKRIILSWAEFHDAGIPAALHLNGRTDHDFLRLAQFVTKHEEIEAVSFEFETGAATRVRGEFYVAELIRFADRVGRPLTLVMRAGMHWFSRLSPSFRQIVQLNSVATMKTRYRRQAHMADGRLRWTEHHTSCGEPLDQLLSHNMVTVSEWMAAIRTMAPRQRQFIPNSVERIASKAKRQAHDETIQLSLL